MLIHEIYELFRHKHIIYLCQFSIIFCCNNSNGPKQQKCFSESLVAACRKLIFQWGTDLFPYFNAPKQYFLPPTKHNVQFASTVYTSLYGSFSAVSVSELLSSYFIQLTYSTTVCSISSNVFQKNCKLPWDVNSNRQNKRRACWPLNAQQLPNSMYS